MNSSLLTRRPSVSNTKFYSKNVKLHWRPGMSDATSGTGHTEFSGGQWPCGRMYFTDSALQVAGERQSLLFD